MGRNKQGKHMCFPFRRIQLLLFCFGSCIIPCSHSSRGIGFFSFFLAPFHGRPTRPTVAHSEPSSQGATHGQGTYGYLPLVGKDALVSREESQQTPHHQETHRSIEPLSSSQITPPQTLSRLISRPELSSSGIALRGYPLGLCASRELADAWTS